MILSWKVNTVAVELEVGTFTMNNTTSQTVNLTNSSLTPKALILWYPSIAAAGSFIGTADFSMGFGTRRGGSTQQGCIGYQSRDNTATTDNARVYNTTILHVLTNTTTTHFTASLTAFATGSFSLSYSVASTRVLHYFVIGGSDITDANVINQTMNSTGATQSITGAGFQPDVLFAMDSDLATANSITANLNFGFGFASSNTQFGTMSITETDGDTMTSAMNWNRSYRTDSCLERLTVNADTSDARWDLDSFDSDGCTLGVVDAPTNTDRVATFLFIKGGTWEVGSKAKRNGTGDDVFTLTNGSLTPKGVMLFTTNQTSVGIGTGDVAHCLGVGTNTAGTQEMCIGDVGPEAINTTRDAFRATDHVLEELTGGTSPAETSRADLTAFNAGSFTLNWAAGSATAILMAYLAIGDTPTAPAYTYANLESMFRGMFRGMGGT